MQRLMTMKLFTDISERVVATFAFAFLGAAVAANGDEFSTEFLGIATGAGIAASCSFVKGMVASRIGEKGTAALLPAEDPTPT
ncbi:MAG: hypothetical protein ACKV2O_24270 [Acidimicrobiales bacterium]